MGLFCSGEAETPGSFARPRPAPRAAPRRTGLTLLRPYLSSNPSSARRSLRRGDGSPRIPFFSSERHRRRTEKQSDTTDPKAHRLLQCPDAQVRSPPCRPGAHPRPRGTPSPPSSVSGPSSLGLPRAVKGLAALWEIRRTLQLTFPTEAPEVASKK